MRLWLLLLALPVWAADDANAILRRWVSAQERNDERSRQYTYVEHTDWATYDADGKLQLDHSQVSEILFVEGLEYSKPISRDGKPLDEREKAQVEKEMRQTAEERRKHRRPRPAGGQISFGRQSIDLGSRAELLSLFENRIVGEEEIRGHKAWVIESTPRADRPPLNEHEREVESFRKKLWIDQTDGVLIRQVCTVTGDRFFAKPGSTITFEYDKIGPETWHEILLVLDVYRVRDKHFAPSGRTEYRMSQFQKFDVQSTITVDIPK